MRMEPYRLVALPALALGLLPALPAMARGISAADREAMLAGLPAVREPRRLTHGHGLRPPAFLLGVVFFLTSARQVVKFVSVFTIGKKKMSPGKPSR